MKKLFSTFVSLLGRVRWEGLRKLLFGKKYNLTPYDYDRILEVLRGGNYVIATARKAHMSTYMCRLSNFLLTGRWGFWSHICMNIDYNGPIRIKDVRILESIGSGVKVSSFYEVFDCDAVCLMRPVLPEGINWEGVIERGLTDIGKKYDNFFDLGDAKQMSCVEVILDSLKSIPNYRSILHGLLAMVRIEHNLTPDMYYDCGSFEVVLEIRK